MTILKSYENIEFFWNFWNFEMFWKFGILWIFFITDKLTNFLFVCWGTGASKFSNIASIYVRIETRGDFFTVEKIH